EIQEASEADDDVEAKRQGGKGERVRRRIDVGVVAVDQWKERRRGRDQESAEAGAAARGNSAENAAAAPDRQQCSDADSVSHDFVGVARPNSPVGTKTRTRTRIEKMITSVQR